MRTRPVAVLDSGVGGLPYLSWLQKNLPHEQLLYVADTKNFPYGNKTSVEVYNLIFKTVSSVIEKENPKLFMLACNTITVQAIDKLRKVLSVPLIGVVPAVKKAAAYQGVIGVLASEGTIKSSYLQQLIHEYCQGRKIIPLAANDIISCVEKHYQDLEKRKEILTQWAKRIKDHGINTLVLGCTHFLHISEDLQELLGDKVKIVDSCDGVGRQTHRILQENGLLNDLKTQSDRLFFTADQTWSHKQLKQTNDVYQSFAECFSLSYLGPWYL